MIYKAQIIDEFTGEVLVEIEEYSLEALEEKLYKLQKYDEKYEKETIR